MLTYPNIDNYLNYYESLTNDLQNYPQLKKSLQRLDNALIFLEIRIGKQYLISSFIAGLSGNHLKQAYKISNKLFEHLQREKQKVQAEINKIRLHGEDYCNGITDSTSLFYYPVPDEWEVLHNLRKYRLEEAIKEYESVQNGNIIDQDEQLQLEIHKTENEIRNSPFFGNVLAETPLVKSIVEKEKRTIIIGEQRITGTGWDSFCSWVHLMDYLNWLVGRNKTIPTTNNVNDTATKPTVASVALCYAYLFKKGGEGLYNNTVLENVAIKYSLSKRTLQNAWNAVVKSESTRTKAATNTNDTNERVKRIVTAIELLKIYGNQEAIKLAESDLSKIRESIKEAEKKKVYSKRK